MTLRLIPVLHNIIVACFDKVILAKSCPKMSLPLSSCFSNAKSQNVDDSESRVVETGAAVEQSQLLLSTGSRNSSSSQDSSGSSQLLIMRLCHQL